MRKSLPCGLLLGLIALLALVAPAAAQNCSVDRETLTFGPVLLGEQRIRTLTVTNEGVEPLALDLIAQPCAGEPAFTVLTAGHFDVAPGASQVIQIRFAPTVAGTHACDVDLGTNDCPPVALDGWGHEYAEPLGNHIGLYTDTDAQLCQAPLDGAGMTVQMRVLAVLPDGVSGVTAAEFRLANLPESQFPPNGHWEATWNTTLVIGNLEQGIALAFNPPLEGAIVELGTLLFTSYDQADWIGADHTVDVLPSTFGQNLVVVDENFDEIPVGGGHFTFNCGNPPDCPCFEQGAPVCDVTPTLLAFGEVPIGGVGYRSFVITNAGTAPLVGAVSADCADFAVTVGDGFFALNPSESKTVQVRFQPSSAEPQVCVVDLGTSDCPSVLCTGVGFTPVPICQVTPSSLDFGDIVAGTTRQLTFEIRNVGTGLLEGAVAENCDDFELLAGAGPFSLTTGQFTFVTVRFAPPLAGDYACTIDLGTDTCDPVEAVGSAHDPIASCALTPDHLDFGDVAIGAFANLDAVLENTGDLPLEGEIVVNHPEFSVVIGGGAFTLPVNDVHVFRVRYTPLDDVPDTATLTTGLAGCSELPLAGTGHEPAPLCVLEPESVDFGEVLLYGAVQQTLSVSNDGDGVLELDLAIDNPDFTFAGDSQLTVLPGGTAHVSLGFSPTSYGTQTATLSLGAAACADVPLGGFGRNPSTGDDHLGLFYDADGTACSGDLPALTHTSLYVIARVPSFASPGITGAEFRVEGIEALMGDAQVTPDWLLPPTGGDLVNGIRFDFAPQPGEVVLLGTLDVYPYAELGADRVLTVERSLDGDQVSVTDGEGLGWDVGHGRFTINCETSWLCDCLDFAAGYCELSTTEIDFGYVNYGHHAYEDFTVTNTGYSALTGDLTITGQYFYLSAGGGPFLLQPGETLTATVRFTPGAVGDLYGTVNTGLAECPAVQLHGIGIGGGGGNPFLGVYADELAVICYSDQFQYQSAAVYVSALLPPWLPGITAAEFSIDNLPATGPRGIRTDLWNTDLVIGEPGYGVALAFSPPLGGPIAILGTLEFFELEDSWIGQDHRLEVAPSQDSGNLVVVGVDFVEYFCEPGHFTFNCTGALGDCDCNVATAVALSDFTLTDLAGAARLDWTLLGGGTPEFRLEGSRDGLSWLVPYDDLGAGRFTAEDHAAALGTAGAVTYTLYGREGDESWQLLRSESLAVAGVPQRTALLPAHPNPFNPKVTIPFSLGAAGPARVAIYDVSGRRVAKLVDGTRPAGPQSVVWQGRDESGRSLGSGVYFVRLEAPGHSETQKLVLMR